MALNSIPGHGTPTILIDGNDAVLGTSANPVNVTGSSVGGDATAANQTAVQGTYAGSTGNQVFVMDPSTGLALTYTAASTVQGDVASGSTNAGNPLQNGGRAATANPTAVTDGQRVGAMFDKLGKQVVVGAIRTLKGVQQTALAGTTGETTIVTAGASGVFQDVYGLVLANTGASTTKVTIKDATSGTTRMIFEVPTLETRGFMVPVDSAVPQASAANNWTATCGTSTSNLEVTALFVSNI